MARKPAKRKPRTAPKVGPKEPIPDYIGSRPDVLTQFKSGNSFWRARTKHGRDKLFGSPEILAEACQEYFDWVEEHPMLEAKPFAYEGMVTIENVPKARVMTLGSLQLFLDISNNTWYEYARNPEFAQICERAAEVIHQQKFGGAAAGFFNAAIIARDLGMVDKKEFSGPNGGPIQTRNVTTEMSAKEAAEAYADELRGDD